MMTGNIIAMYTKCSQQYDEEIKKSSTLNKMNVHVKRIESDK